MEFLLSLLPGVDFAAVIKYGAIILGVVLAVFGIRRSGKKEAQQQATIDNLKGTLKDVKTQQDVKDRISRLTPDERRRLLERWRR